MLRAPLHPQSQGAIEEFNKYIQNWLYKAYDNISKSNVEEKREFKRNMELRFNDKQFSSLFQLKKKAYNNRIYS